LKKGVPVLETEVISEANAWIEPDFSLIEHPMRVLDEKERNTRTHIVKMYEKRSDVGDGKLSQR
jgi:hypothetical protein